jgi:mycofactocin precursor
MSDPDVTLSFGIGCHYTCARSQDQLNIHIAEEPAMPEDTITAVAESTVADPTASLVEEDLLVEDVSIDGMCGVY